MDDRLMHHLSFIRVWDDSYNLFEVHIYDSIFYLTIARKNYLFNLVKYFCNKKD